jgi:cytidylate kinase
MLIAIDGPAGSGKSSAAKALAKKLNIYYLNTGFTFRAIAYKKSTNFGIRFNKDKQAEIFSDNKKLDKELQTPKIDLLASKVAQNPKVRKLLVKMWQQAMFGKSAVIEGRDIAQVFPNADLKIYLTAKVWVRAKRIWLKYQKLGIKKTLGQIEADIKKRDNKDSKRKINPLKLSKYYQVIDTTDMSIDDEVKTIIDKI